MRGDIVRRWRPIAVVGSNFSKCYIHSHESLRIFKKIKFKELKIHLADVSEPKPLVILKSLLSPQKNFNRLLMAWYHLIPAVVKHIFLVRLAGFRTGTAFARQLACLPSHHRRSLNQAL